MQSTTSSRHINEVAMQHVRRLYEEVASLKNPADAKWPHIKSVKTRYSVPSRPLYNCEQMHLAPERVGRQNKTLRPDAPIPEIEYDQSDILCDKDFSQGESMSVDHIDKSCSNFLICARGTSTTLFRVIVLVSIAQVT
ncbi:hypothetical protein SeLEV6574_g00577 [Synchytrium endobioticum]|nr:hypothetical protein SeLEV6574_g00577 [Synchytrium endobioticum]